MRLTSVGYAARSLGVARETVLYRLRRLGIHPLRDTTGRRLLTEADLKRLQGWHPRPRSRA